MIYEAFIKSISGLLHHKVHRLLVRKFVFLVINV